MTKNPFLNALAAGFYIVFISIVMYWATLHAPKGPTLMAPIVMIFLFTLSAALMGYVFCYQPIQLYFDGKKKLAVQLFLQTVAIFGGFSVIAIILLFLGVFR